MEDWLSLFEETKQKYIEDFKEVIKANPDLLEQDVFDKIIRPKTEIYQKNYCRFKNEIFERFWSSLVAIDFENEFQQRITRFIKYDLPEITEKHKRLYAQTAENGRLDTWDYDFLSESENKIIEYLIDRFVFEKIRNNEEGFDILPKSTNTESIDQSNAESSSIISDDSLKKKQVDQDDTPTSYEDNPTISTSDLSQKQFAIFITLLQVNDVIPQFSKGKKLQELENYINIYSPHKDRSIDKLAKIIENTGDKPSLWKKEDVEEVVKAIRVSSDLIDRIDNLDYILEGAS